MNRKFTYQGRRFYLDGKPIVVRSGAIHYFRVPKAYWYDRLLKLKECGFNCVETYIPWNVHEPKEGQFVFDGAADFCEFLKIADGLGLLAIVRPGPYICAEWDFGGFPAWLLSYPDMELRCYNERYIQKLRPFLVKTLEKLRPQMIENGGNVIMLQVENEYGSYGNDKKYLRTLYGIYRECGMQGILFTSDGASPFMLGAGQIDGCLSFANFGSRTEEQMGVLEQFVGDSQPLGCMEFWGGWFDYWHEAHHTSRSVEEICGEMETLLKNGYTFNYYMFHGGTNFAFTSGATDMRGEYKTVVTSYDDLAVLTEAGDRTPLYYALRDLMGKYGAELPPITACETVKTAYGKVAFKEVSLLFDELDVIGTAHDGVRPKYMEDMGQASGYALYIADLADYHLGEVEVRLYDCCDRAIVFTGGEKRGVYERSLKENPPICLNKQDCSDRKLTVLLENTGRTGYGENFCKRKGIADICIWGQRVFGWKSISLPMDDLSGLTFRALENPLPKTPAFYRAEFKVEQPNDTFLRLDGFGKGFAVINGFNLGRYYTAAGPQKTLFVPACVLKQGENELIVFDSDGTKNAVAEFVDTPEL